MTLREHGYLSPNMGIFIEDARAAHAQWFRCADSLNAFAQACLTSSDLRVPKHDNRRLLASLLLVRLASGFQGVILLGERGMITEARYVLRSILEIVFNIAATVKDPDFPLKSVYRTLRHNRTLANVLIELPPELIHRKISREDLIRREAELKKDIGDSGVAKMTVEEIARSGGLADLYETAYRELSSPAHVLVGDLDAHVTADVNGEIQKLSWGPNRDAIPDMIDLAGRFLLIGLHHIIELFELKVFEPQHDACWQQLKRLEDQQ